jgi:uncharacterized protein YndB with AHSA1/START domain
MFARSFPVAVLLAIVPVGVHAELKTAWSDGFVLVYTKRIEAPAARIYAALPAVDRWWSSGHTWSGDAAHLSLKAEAGGCFCEKWKDGEVEHGRVIMVMRDQILRLQAALGPLQGRGVTGVLTFQLKPDAASSGKATLLTLSYIVNGASASALDKSAGPVDNMLNEQFERLVRYIETGKAVAQ